MIEGYYSLKTNLSEFENAVRSLSMGINNSGISWRDAQYEQLAGIIGTIASSSKGVIQAGERCESAIERFDSIASGV